MADDRLLKEEWDRPRIHVMEEYDIRYWTQKFGVS
jgi:hypothetical protein